MTDSEKRPAPSQNELIPVIHQGQNVLIDAQLLHRQLKAKGRYYDWITYRIKEYGFKDGDDFFATKKVQSKQGGHNAITYLLTMDMAKELAMLERSETGRTIRRYFIEKEKQLRAISQLPKELSLFKGLKCKRINDRPLYPYRELLVRCGYKANNNGNRRQRYWMHFVKEGTVLYVTEEFALHLYHQKQVLRNRSVMLASQPVLPFNFQEGGTA